MNKYTRPCIEALNAYRVESPNYPIILNANESPWDLPPVLKEKICEEILKTPFNRYPEACFPQLLKDLAEYTDFSTEQIIAGNGSDELISMLYQAFVESGEAVVSHAPSFAMYGIWGTISGAHFVQVTDLDNHIPDIEGIIKKANTHHAKIIFLCNPNNPTGYGFSEEQILYVLKNTSALVVLDEAYMEFNGNSCAHLLHNHHNLIIMRTLSKAFGMAGIRCGYLIASVELVHRLYKVKAPYNLNAMTQIAASVVLQNRALLKSHLLILSEENQKMNAFLSSYKQLKVYPSASNFIYFETEVAEKIYSSLKDKGVLVKYFKKAFTQPEAIRLTLGSPEENTQVKAHISEVLS